MTMSTKSEFEVAIIGGGITGLATAYYLQKTAQESDFPLRYTLIESSSRLGGKLMTDVVTGPDGQPFVIEGGPDCFLTQKPWAVDLALELGLSERLLGTNDDRRKVYVLNKGRPTPLPDGVLLIVPTKFTPFALSPLISPLGKLRMGMDLFIKAKQDDEDETLADFITRRLGHEALDKIAEPLMSGIYNAEADRQSVMATFPRFRAIEKNHGSLIKGMLASRKARPSSAESQPAAANNGRPSTVFATMQGGVEELAIELANRLSGDVLTEAEVINIGYDQGKGYTLTLSQSNRQQTLTADFVVLTTPAFVTSKLVRNLAPESAAQLGSIRYVSTGTISLAYRDADLAGVVDGFGLVIPHSEGRPINAVTFSSTKFDNRAPDGYSLLRVFFGGSRSPQSMELDDEALLATVLDQLRDILGITAEPLFHRIYRWWSANPQYDVGHLERVDEIVNTLPDGLLVTGSPYHGVGIPDCVRQAQLICKQISDRVCESDNMLHRAGA